MPDVYPVAAVRTGPDEELASIRGTIEKEGEEYVSLRVLGSHHRDVHVDDVTDSVVRLAREVGHDD